MFHKVRRYHRHSISGSAVITRRDAGSPKELVTRVNTISQGGMGFYSEVFIEKATPVSVELLFQSGSPTGGNVLAGKIASVCSQEKDYYMGIAFDNEISFDRFIEIIG